jgi:hypothetical protein
MKLSDKYKGKVVLILCADCGKIKKHTHWVRLTEVHWEKLKNREIEIILDSCGCIFCED